MITQIVTERNNIFVKKLKNVAKSVDIVFLLCYYVCGAKRTEFEKKGIVL